MNRFVKSGLFILLGVAMLGWFVYSLTGPPEMDEVYLYERFKDVVRLAGAIAFFVAGILALRR